MQRHHLRRALAAATIIAVALVILFAVLHTPSEEYHLADDQWIKVQRMNDQTSIYSMTQEPIGRFSYFSFVALDPILSVPGNPKISIEPPTTMILRWENGRSERHDFDDLRDAYLRLHIDIDLDGIEKAFRKAEIGIHKN